ncbi:glycoside hydrolase family 2 protein [Prolixibacteraceae bacterium JC049]|nr:glycoside hydrolase family 2 protein [Prolixibacteraceae bacterium JC049]
MSKFLSAIILCCLAVTVFGQQRKRVTLNNDWQFVKSDLGGPYEAIRKPFNRTIAWQKVQLPHCYNALDGVNPDVKYYEGATWYKRMLSVKESWGDKRVLLHFEGVGQKAQVYINEQLVGKHVGGYDEWRVDITSALKQELPQSKNQKVVLSVRVDNSRDLEMIPSDMSDFNVYGGIYRNVWLEVVPTSYINQLKVTSTLSKNRKKAVVDVAFTLKNANNVSGKVKTEITDPSGRRVAKGEASFADGSMQLQLKKPKLWSIETPELYSCKVTATSEVGSDIQEFKIGIRDFEFKEKGPFFLNGKRVLLRGTHCHEDHAGYGAATPDSIVRREMQMMKDMGVNFLRLGHYQQSELVLSLCDSLGIVVWEEIPWCRGGLGGKTYQAQAKRMLRNMINQHYNHPSVILWGLGNENDWRGDFKEFDKQAIKAFMSELNDIAHEMDSQRKTSIRRCKFCSDVVDVYSPSIWAGWYRGKFTEYKKVSEEEAAKVTRFIHVEWGGSSHARRHSESPDKGLEKIPVGQGADERNGDFLMKGGIARASKDGDWSESYICNLMDWHLKEQETMDWLTGTAQWVFKDFSTPLRPDNPLPYINQKGVIQRDLTPKESYYVFQSYWAEKPMIHIYGHTWPERWGEAGEEKLIKVYSNCEQVELFLNGESLGKRKRNSQDFPAAGLRWKVVFKAGENKIEAIGIKDGSKVTDTIVQNYEDRQWTTPSQVKLTLKRKGEKVNEFELRVSDKTGITCLDARNWVRYEFMGEGELIKDMGTVNGSSLVQLCNGRSWCQLKNAEGILKVEVKNVKTVFYRIDKEGRISEI